MVVGNSFWVHGINCCTVTIAKEYCTNHMLQLLHLKSSLTSWRLSSSSSRRIEKGKCYKCRHNDDEYEWHCSCVGPISRRAYYFPNKRNYHDKVPYRRWLMNQFLGLSTVFDNFSDATDDDPADTSISTDSPSTASDDAQRRRLGEEEEEMTKHQRRLNRSNHRIGLHGTYAWQRYHLRYTERRWRKKVTSRNDCRCRCRCHQKTNDKWHKKFSSATSACCCCK